MIQLAQCKSRPYGFKFIFYPSLPNIQCLPIQDVHSHGLQSKCPWVKGLQGSQILCTRTLKGTQGWTSLNLQLAECQNVRRDNTGPNTKDTHLQNETNSPDPVRNQTRTAGLEGRDLPTMPRRRKGLKSATINNSSLTLSLPSLSYHYHHYHYHIITIIIIIISLLSLSLSSHYHHYHSLPSLSLSYHYLHYHYHIITIIIIISLPSLSL